MASVIVSYIINWILWVHAQDSVNPTLILPTGPTAPLDDKDAISSRYTIKQATTRLKPRDTKKMESLNAATQIPQPASHTSSLSVEPSKPEPVANSNPTPSLIEMNLAPNFIFYDAQSNYWFRKYSSASPGLDVNVSIWLSPKFGMQSSYVSTLGAEIAGSPSDVSHITVAHQWFTLSLQGREYDSIDPRRHLIYGLKFSDYQFQAPVDSQYRVRLKTSGLGIHLRMVTPKDPVISNFFEVEIFPQTKHKEVQTNIALNSGDRVETNMISIGLGQFYKIVDKSHFFWGLRASFEKHNFTGTANTSDPKTNQTPSGVTVTNQIYMLEFGYQWGH